MVASKQSSDVLLSAVLRQIDKLHRSLLNGIVECAVLVLLGFEVDLDGKHSHGIDYKLDHHSGVAGVAEPEQQLQVESPKVDELVGDELAGFTEEEELACLDEDDKDGERDHEGDEVEEEGYFLAYSPEGGHVLAHAHGGAADELVAAPALVARVGQLHVGTGSVQLAAHGVPDCQVEVGRDPILLILGAHAAAPLPNIMLCL